ncbi:MAG: ABC transporter substrate-binding protein [Myxococcaceae bacterium]|nr:ABC transporter substrate-binding protein [Myxococcaceae bacterium]
MTLLEQLRAAPPYPRRVVCLTEETCETLYRIGAGELVVGVSGFTVRPREARRKPRISSFLAADYEQVVALRPDLVIGFSDLQAPLGAELARRGVPVVLFNQRSLAEILQTVRTTAALVGRAEQGEALALELTAALERVGEAASHLPRRPRAFFEEWHEPLISGIRWCSELLELAGADDVCAHTRSGSLGKERIVDPLVVARADPELIIASWCGRKASAEKIAARPGFSAVSAVRADQLYEVKSTFILQPGPACILAGAPQLAAIVAAVARGEQLPRPRPGDLRAAPLPPSY